MWEDPIVEAVHRTREQLAAEFNFDIKAIFADLRKRQVSLGGRLILQKKGVEPPETRAARGSREGYDRVLAKVPDADPMLGDERQASGRTND